MDERSRQNNSSSADTNNELLPGMSPDKAEFYKTYDVMTGVRIAATLGGFFSLMVLLVAYKSKCKSRSVSEEDLAAVAAAVVEEEERKETERRLSLYGGGRVQTVTRTRTSLVPGGPAFTAYHHPALPVGVYARHQSLTPSPPMTTYNQGEEDELPEVWRAAAGKRAPGMQHLLRVPSSRRSSRRFSSVTCSSCDSSYLERRGSALEIGHPIPPPFINTSSSDRLDEEPWDYYYPIDIQVIQPTPQVSPRSSQATINNGRAGVEIGVMQDESWLSKNLPLTHLSPTIKSHPSGIAPLAAHDPRSESLQLSTSYHFQSDRQPSPQPTDQERSLGSDSVFLDEELIDTEDEVDGFSTDSESGSSPVISATSGHTEERKIPSRLAGRILRPPDSEPSSYLLSQYPFLLKQPDPVATSFQHHQRRFSSPTGLQTSTEIGETICDKASSTTLEPAVIVTGTPLEKCKKTSSDSDTLLAIPAFRNCPSSSIEARSFMSISCDRLVESLQRSQSDLNNKNSAQHCAWSQETLF